jgi:hypothetical protein
MSPDERYASLLWPPPRPASPGPARLDARAIADLDLAAVVQALTGGDGSRDRFVTAVLAELCADPEVIAYRQAVVVDLSDDAELRRRLGEVRPKLADLMRAQGARQRPGTNVSAIARRVEELERYVKVARDLREALEPAGPRSAALRTLRAQVLARTGTPEFRSLDAALPDLRATLERIGSVTRAT